MAAGTAESNIITQKIAYYKFQYFECLMGYDLARAFIAAMDEYDDQNPYLTEQRWLNLAYGSTYVGDDTMVYKWKGFTTHSNPDTSLEDEFISPFADFVYVKHMAQITDVTTTLGVKEAAVENMASKSPIQLRCEAWYRMCDAHWHFHNFITTNIADYAISGKYIGELYPPDINLKSNISDNQNLFIPTNVYGI